MAGYVYNWGDADVTDAMMSVKCAGIISEAGADGYGGTNWCFTIVGKEGQQWHAHLNGGKDGRKVNVLRYKKSSTDAGGSNVIKFLDTGSGYPTNKENMKRLASVCGTDYPQFNKLLTALAQAHDTYVLANS